MKDQSPVTQAEFTHVMNAMADVFPSINSKSRIKFYYFAVKDTPLECLRDISTNFLMSSKQMPLPNDFINAVNEWRRTNEIKKYNPEESSPILCEKCGDLGIVRIQNHHDPDFDCLMSCDCKVSITKTLNAPIWDNGLLAAYKKTKCPLEWFKPAGTEVFDKNNSEIKTIIKNWNARKERAENYWSDMGYVH